MTTNLKKIISRYRREVKKGTITKESYFKFSAEFNKEKERIINSLDLNDYDKSIPIYDSIKDIELKFDDVEYDAFEQLKAKNVSIE